ncbi:MAG TPA: hypothetical protein DEB45_08075 [Alteromonas australica]|uniref:Tn3 transposase DDE domain-containing protein n=1 Tax=Alteromonas australica TaxID=589873 RepID=A0A358DZ45_9ALTE|nr:hypothetical protein [Alteromonas australica]
MIPKSKINKKLILDNWDDILRLIVSMKLGRCLIHHVHYQSKHSHRVQ